MPRAQAGSISAVHRSRVLVAGSWLASTAVATLVSAAGVSIVTRDVTDDHRRALAAADVVALLHGHPEPPVGETAVNGASVVSTADPPAAVDTSSLPDVAVPSPIAARGATSRPSPPVAPNRDRDAVPSTATFATAGGVVAVTCTGGSASLASARPNDGHQVLVHDDGPVRVVVEFAGSTSEQLTAECGDHAPVLLDESALAASAHASGAEQPVVTEPARHDTSRAEAPGGRGHHDARTDRSDRHESRRDPARGHRKGERHRAKDDNRGRGERADHGPRGGHDRGASRRAPGR